MRDHSRVPLRRRRIRDLIVWPEVPAPFYYYDDPAFRDNVDDLARSTHA